MNDLNRPKLVTFDDESGFNDSPFGQHWNLNIHEWAKPHFASSKILDKRNLVIADKSSRVSHAQADSYSKVANDKGPKYNFRVYSDPDGEKVLEMYNDPKMDVDKNKPYEVLVFIETDDGKFDFGKIVRVKFGPAVVEDLKDKYFQELPWDDNDAKDIAKKFIEAAWTNGTAQQTIDSVDKERKDSDFEDLLIKAIKYENNNQRFDDFSWFVFLVKGTEYVGFKLSDWCFSSGKWLRERKYIEDKYWNGDLPEDKYTPAFMPDSIFYEKEEDRKDALKKYFDKPFIDLKRFVGEKIDGDGPFEKKLALDLYLKINAMQDLTNDIVDKLLAKISITDSFYIEAYIKHLHAFYVGLYNGILEFLAGICDLTAIVVLVCRTELGFRMTDILNEKFENFVNDLYYKTLETLKKIWNAIVKVFEDFGNWFEQFSEYDGKSYKIVKEIGELIPDILTFVVPILKGSKAAKLAQVGGEGVAAAERKVVKEVVEETAEEMSEAEAKKIAKSAKEAIENDVARETVDEAVDKVEQQIAEKAKVPEKLDEVVVKRKAKAKEKSKVKNLELAEKMWKEFDYDDLMKIRQRPPVKKPCFLAGTLVKTEKGLLPIENVDKGDKVYAYNFDANSAELQLVTEVYTNVTEAYLQIKTANDTIKATGQHRFWIPEQNSWIMANSLTESMQFLSFDNKLVVIESLEIIQSDEKTFNLEVENHHNYFVGNDELLTHNATRPSKFASLEVIEVEFYQFENFKRKPLYIGQTTQSTAARHYQHELAFKNNPTSKSWFKEAEIFGKLRINNVPGPYLMTPYETAVVEMFEINLKGGKRVGSKGLFNKVNPITKAKFEKYKNLGSFNPCKFYV